jgi:K+ transport systems, NAD-binding component
MVNRFSPIITISVMFFAIALIFTIYAGVPLENAIVWNVLSSLDVTYYTLPVSYASSPLVFGASVMDVLVFVLLAVWLAGVTFGFLKEIDISGRIIAGKIKRLRGHVIVTPYNQFAMELIGGLKGAGHRFVVITDKEKVAEGLIRDGILAIIKEPDSIETFYDAGVKSAKSVVICSESDLQNIMIGIAAKSANKDVHIISRLGDSSNAGHMETVGIYKTVSPEESAGDEIAGEVVKRIL